MTTLELKTSRENSCQLMQRTGKFFIFYERNLLTDIKSKIISAMDKNKADLCNKAYFFVRILEIACDWESSCSIAAAFGKEINEEMKSLKGIPWMSPK